MYRPSERGAGADLRDLGFAMTLIVSKPPRSPELEANRHGDLKRLARILAGVDRVGAHLRRLGAMRRRPRVRTTAASGVSVLIPERDNPAELAECLHAVARAIGQTGEPAEVIVSASGARGQHYAELRGLYPEVRWAMSAVPLDFHMAVRRGLSMARYDWVYLLNNDAAPEPDALTAILPLRSSDVFAIGSQIEYKDPTRFREETNWGGFAVQDGLAAIADGIPSSDRPTECFYAGGGASLFRRALLQRLLTASSAYAPFYWEDVEWGWRARKLGYRVLFCPASVVRHRHRATIGRLYSAEEIERVWARNRVLFQLRNMTVCGSTDRLLEELVRLQDAEQFARRPMVWRIARARLWNWLAPVPDDTLLRNAEAMQP
jgi:GT2 family glycosyltransferase